MKLGRLGEFGLIEKIRRIAPGASGVLLGIGDDAAWVKAKTSSFLITADLLIENVHFDFKWTSPYALGYKSLAVNLSDIAAMGGTPAYLMLSVGIPVEFDAQVVEEFYRGVRFLALRCGVALVGGDTSASESFFVSVALVGHAPHRPIGRSGAKAGDDLYVTGKLGDSALALSLLRHRPRKTKGRAGSYLLSRHHFPTPRIKAGTLLAREKLAKAMLDVSDGLLQDLGHLCKASNVGAVVLEDSLPLSRAYRSAAGLEGTRFALTGGEDYELLFTARRRDRSRLEKLRHRLDVPITRIGRCVAPREGIAVLNTDGEPRSIRIKGYDHFKFRS